jgi:CBS-domain-containing membrane protein
MNAQDVMVSDVITVGPDARIEDVADLLLRNRISAVPVLDKDGNLLGIVSEGDLLRRPEAGTERPHSVWLEFLTARETLAEEFIRSHSRKASDVMTRDVITVTPATPVGEIAALLERNRIKRVPVMKGGKLVGIVSRANLIQALASLKTAKLSKEAEADGAIRDKLVAELNVQAWTRPSLLNVTVQNGTVELWGIVDSEAERKAVHTLAEVTPGVRAVDDNLTVWRYMSGI